MNKEKVQGSIVFKFILPSALNHFKKIGKILLDSYNQFMCNFTKKIPEYKANKKLGAEYAKFWIFVQEIMEESVIYAIINNIVIQLFQIKIRVG